VHQRGVWGEDVVIGRERELESVGPWGRGLSERCGGVGWGELFLYLGLVLA
jgi:hypothetical protein